VGKTLSTKKVKVNYHAVSIAEVQQPHAPPHHNANNRANRTASESDLSDLRDNGQRFPTPLPHRIHTVPLQVALGFNASVLLPKTEVSTIFVLLLSQLVHLVETVTNKYEIHSLSSSRISNINCHFGLFEAGFDRLNAGPARTLTSL
jgi:hypothetical protein